MLIARALVGQGGDCPTIEWDGQREHDGGARDPRVEPCSASCAKAARPLAETLEVRRSGQGSTVLLDQQVTRRPERSVHRAGDTGCRVTFYFDQGCSDRAQMAVRRRRRFGGRQAGPT